jgi:hypothetical protein
VLLLLEGKSQHFTHYLPIEKVEQTGWYKLQLPAQFLAVSTPNLSDVRLLQRINKDTQIQVPYFIEEEKPKDDSIWFEPFKIQKSSPYIYFIQHKLSAIDAMEIQVNNHADVFSFSLAGSKNGKDWFSIDESIDLPASTNTESGENRVTIQFPRINYPYLKLKFKDTLATPIQILGAGVYRNAEHVSSLNRLVQIRYSIEQLPNEKITRIKIVSPYVQQVDKISFSISSPVLFQREVSVYQKVAVTHKGKVSYRSEPMSSFSLHSSKSFAMLTRMNLMDTLFLDIQNEDNPALQIADISLFQYPRILFAYLEKGSELNLYTGNKELSLPAYDIVNFISEKEKAQSLSFRALQVIERNSAITETPKPFYESRSFMWICLAIGMLALVFFAIKLIPSNEN